MTDSVLARQERESERLPHGRGGPASALVLATWLSREHRRRLHSTNLLERLHKEIKRRTRVADEDRRRLGIAAVRAEEREDP